MFALKQFKLWHISHRHFFLHCVTRMFKHRTRSNCAKDIKSTMIPKYVNCNHLIYRSKIMLETHGIDCSCSLEYIHSQGDSVQFAGDRIKESYLLIHTMTAVASFMLGSLLSIFFKNNVFSIQNVQCYLWKSSKSYSSISMMLLFTFAWGVQEYWLKLVLDKPEVPEASQ